MRKKQPVSYSSCRVIITGLSLLTAALGAAAQGSPAGPPAVSPPPGGSQQGIGGPPVGQPQQQDLQRRQQQMQQTQQQSAPPPAGAAGAAGSPPGPGAPAGQSAPMGAPGGTGTVGEPSGTTTPPASFGGAPRGGTMTGTATGAARVLAVAPAQLSLPQAIALGLDNNLTTLLATERAAEARALRQQVRSFLLPNLSGTAYQQNRTLNLVAQGLVPAGGQDMMSGGMGGAGGGAAAAPTIPSFVGPFNTFDARLNFSQALLNLAAMREYKSSTAAVRVADLTAELAREQVATFVALAYLTAQRGALEVRAARADLSLAEALRQLAQKQRDVGVANGIDVVRAAARGFAAAPARGAGRSQRRAKPASTWTGPWACPRAAPRCSPTRWWPAPRPCPPWKRPWPRPRRPASTPASPSKPSRSGPWTAAPAPPPATPSSAPPATTGSRP